MKTKQSFFSLRQKLRLTFTKTGFIPHYLHSIIIKWAKVCIKSFFSACKKKLEKRLRMEFSFLFISLVYWYSYKEIIYLFIFPLCVYHSLDKRTHAYSHFQCFLPPTPKNRIGKVKRSLWCSVRTSTFRKMELVFYIFFFYWKALTHAHSRMTTESRKGGSEKKCLFFLYK